MVRVRFYDYKHQQIDDFRLQSSAMSSSGTGAVLGGEQSASTITSTALVPVLRRLPYILDPPLRSW